MAKISLKVKGMHCKSCDMLIKDVLSDIDGVKKVDSSFSKGLVDVEFDEKKTNVVTIKKAIEGEGYTVGSY